MKIKIVVEDKKKGRIEIPLTKREIEDLFDIGFIIMGKKIDQIFKLNKIDKSWRSFCYKIQYLLNDIINDGKCYELVEDRKGKRKSKLLKEKWYLVKKPNWKR